MSTDEPQLPPRRPDIPPEPDLPPHMREPEPPPPVSGGSADRPDDFATPQILDDFSDTVEERLPATRWHIGLDFGLLILRVAVGGTLLLHGLYKFGEFGGPGITGTADSLGENFSQSTALAWVLAVTEVGAGGALVAGLLTPLAAAVILAVMAVKAFTLRDFGYFSEYVGGGAQLVGYAFALMVGAGALALLFTGPGRIALDAPTPWRRKPLAFGLVGVFAAAAAALAVVAIFLTDGVSG